MGDLLTDRIRRTLSDNPGNVIDDPSLTPAGVMLLVYPKNGEYCVLLNKRSNKVDDHKGEISFPGGRKDANDPTLLDTAMRETHEEMGINPQHIEVLGELDDQPTTSRYLIRPYAATIPYPYDFSPSEIEVAEVLEVPISSLMDSNNRRDEIRIINGNLDNTPAFAHNGHIIFGATARILHRFLQLLETSNEETP